MRSLLASLALSLVVAAPAALAAQNTTAFAAAPAAPAVTPATAAAGTPAPSAMVRPDVAGIRANQAVAADHTVNSAAASGGLHQGQGVALMAVGGAGLIAGLLIGDSAGTAIAIGGLAVGLVGLYQYIR